LSLIGDAIDMNELIGKLNDAERLDIPSFAGGRNVI
jgi:hypothetical protein